MSYIHTDTGTRVGIPIIRGMRLVDFEWPLIMHPFTPERRGQGCRGVYARWCKFIESITKLKCYLFVFIFFISFFIMKL